MAGSQLLLPRCAKSVLELVAPHLPPRKAEDMNPGETSRTIGVFYVVTNTWLSEVAVKCRVAGKE